MRALMLAMAVAVVGCSKPTRDFSVVKPKSLDELEDVSVQLPETPIVIWNGVEWKPVPMVVSGLLPDGTTLEIKLSNLDRPLQSWVRKDGRWIDANQEGGAK